MKPTNLYEQKQISKAVKGLNVQLEKFYSAARSLRGMSSPSLEANLAIIDARAHLDNAILKLQAAKKSLAD